MRTPAGSLASVFTGLLLTASALGAQAGSQQPRTIEGTVTDSVTGAPIGEAAVSLEAGVSRVLTDAAGHFVLKGVPGEGQFSLAVEQLGYTSRLLMVDAGTPAVALRMVPNPAALRGLKTLDAEIRQQMGLSANARLFNRRALLTADASGLRQFLLQRGVHPPVRAPFPRGPDDLVRAPGGVQVQPNVYVDGSAISGGFAAMPDYQLTDLYAIVVANGGADVVVWSNAYIERIARTVGHF